MAFKRRFFERYARANEFDPLIAENWYNVIDNDVKAQKVPFPATCFSIFMFIEYLQYINSMPSEYSKIIHKASLGL